MHQNPAESSVPSPLTQWKGLLKQQPVSSPSRLRDADFLDVAASSRGFANAEIVDEKLRIGIADLVAAVRSLLHDEHESAAEYLRRASDILSNILEVSAERLSSRSERESPDRAEPGLGGLAPWQIRRVTSHIEAHLDETIRNMQLATAVGLSPSHFSRAFRKSFADSPHSYIMQRRVERAQRLMLTTNFPLAQIADHCGISDQAHLNKLFQRFVGVTPRNWRRARVSGCMLMHDQFPAATVQPKKGGAI
jgi:AraC family transcriptional regulator